ncbi:hypothetical protein Kisp01_69200 [Kineosporia sp. NBRC 101677]|uniref:hypothetical protein n=1 Tax=Kineosporia sp. NBRC 101677 TaxID=3032197 RepID=UPI00249FF707|nr:hypothetical protein [Kineosporia sp. NBRC 101677]GLY19906.1 hypothetical protein Kisp01_69200 [Kineosporia sp. NBRC 101677]
MDSTPREQDRTPTSGSKPPGHDLFSGGLRFLTELIAWIAAPWALWPHSILLAIGVVLLLIVPPAIFSTPGDRPGGDTPIAVPGAVTILMLLSHLVAATAAAWALWPTWIAVAVTTLCVVVVITEQPRWRALTRRSRP